MKPGAATDAACLAGGVRDQLSSFNVGEVYYARRIDVTVNRGPVKLLQMYPAKIQIGAALIQAPNFTHVMLGFREGGDSSITFDRVHAGVIGRQGKRHVTTIESQQVF